MDGYIVPSCQSCVDDLFKQFLELRKENEELYKENRELRNKVRAALIFYVISSPTLIIM